MLGIGPGAPNRGIPKGSGRSNKWSDVTSPKRCIKRYFITDIWTFILWVIRWWVKQTVERPLGEGQPIIRAPLWPDSALAGAWGVPPPCLIHVCCCFSGRRRSPLLPSSPSPGECLTGRPESPGFREKSTRRSDYPKPAESGFARPNRMLGTLRLRRTSPPRGWYFQSIPGRMRHSDALSDIMSLSSVILIELLLSGLRFCGTGWLGICGFCSGSSGCGFTSGW